jgi:CheY-like chemotaxis protein
MSGADGSLKDLHVLVVEDEALVSFMLVDYLEELGCQVVATASRLEEALEMAASLTALDLAVLDVNLAGEMSYPVAELLRSRGVPFLFATGYGTDGLPEGMRNVPVLSKPFGLERFAEALRLTRAG